MSLALAEAFVTRKDQVSIASIILRPSWCSRQSPGDTAAAAELRPLLQHLKDELLRVEIELVANTEVGQAFEGVRVSGWAPFGSSLSWLYHVAHCQEAIRRFERAYADLVSSFTEQIQALYPCMHVPVICFVLYLFVLVSIFLPFSRLLSFSHVWRGP